MLGKMDFNKFGAHKEFVGCAILAALTWIKIKILSICYKTVLILLFLLIGRPGQAGERGLRGERGLNGVDGKPGESIQGPPGIPGKFKNVKKDRHHQTLKIIIYRFRLCKGPNFQFLW